MSTDIPNRDARNTPKVPVLDQGVWKMPIVVDQSTVHYRLATEAEILVAETAALAQAEALAEARKKTQAETKAAEKKAKADGTAPDPTKVTGAPLPTDKPPAKPGPHDAATGSF